MNESTTSEKNIDEESDSEHLKKFEAIYSDNIKYEISLYKRGNNIILETKIPKDLQFIKYSNEYDMDTLKQSNKFLSLCETIDDIIDSIYENASSFSCTIHEKGKDYELKIPVPVKSIKEITFILKENEKHQNDIINDLCLNSILSNRKIEDQTKKIEQHKNQIEEQSLKIEELNKKMNQLEMRILLLEEQNKNIINEMKKLSIKDVINEPKINENNKNEIKNYEGEINPILKQNSRIISNDLFRQLNIWINPFKSLKFELIFTASINGDDCKNFHKFCDGKGPTVTICKSDKGQIFGGYVTVPFSSDNKVHYDDKAFLFSLTNNKKFSIKTKEPAVCHLYYWGPLFGNNHKEDLAIPQYGLRGKRNLSEPNSYEFRREDLIGTEEKNQNFMLDEYEVFLVN